MKLACPPEDMCEKPGFEQVNALAFGFEKANIESEQK